MGMFMELVADEHTADLECFAEYIEGVDHIAVAVVDLEESKAWYRGRLGFQCIDERITRGAHTAMTSAVMVSGPVTVVLVQGLQPQSQVSRFIEHFSAGVQHVALRVSNLDAVMRRVDAWGGFADTQIIESPFARQVFLRREGGCGVRIELIERRSSGFDDRSVEQLFRKFELDDLY
jgi:methylmalonyl-CoA/ethylmalonyl-CoA epimerase